MSALQVTPRKIVAIDMDEVIADALGGHLARYNREFGANLTPENLRGRWLWDCVPAAHHATIERYMLAEDFFASLEVLPDAQRVLARLQTRYEVFIATAAMEVPSSFNAKFEWLARHFPFIPTSHIVFCGDKRILRADFLIDDNPRQLQRFQEARNGEPAREGILFTSPSNANVSGFRRVDSWLEVEALFLD